MWNSRQPEGFRRPEAELRSVDVRGGGWVRPGWQDRFLRAFESSEYAESCVDAHADRIREAFARDQAYILMGDSTDSLLTAAATARVTFDQAMRLKKSPLVAVGTSTPEQAIGVAHGLSVLLDPKGDVGGLVGYATAENPRVDPDRTRVVIRPQGNFLRLLLQGKLDDVGSIVVDGAWGDTYEQAMLFGVLKYRKDRVASTFPPVVLAAREYQASVALSDFFNTDSSRIQFGFERSHSPTIIPFHPEVFSRSPKTRHSTIASLLRGEMKDAPGDILIFAQNASDARDLANDLRDGFEGVRKTCVLSSKTDPKERLQLLFSDSTLKTPGRLIISDGFSLDILRLAGAVRIVIDSGKSFISADEAYQRASFAQDGTCYRLYSDDDMRGQTYPFRFFSEDTAKAVALLRSHNIDPKTFPWFGEMDHELLDKALASSASSSERRDLDAENVPLSPLEQEMVRLGLSRDQRIAVQALTPLLGTFGDSIAIACLRESELLLREETRRVHGPQTNSDVLFRLRLFAEALEYKIEDIVERPSAPVPDQLQRWATDRKVNIGKVAHMVSVFARRATAGGKIRIDSRAVASIIETIRRLSGEDITRVLSQALPDNIVVHSSSTQSEMFLSSEHTVRIGRDSVSKRRVFFESSSPWAEREGEGGTHDKTDWDKEREREAEACVSGNPLFSIGIRQGEAEDSFTLIHPIPLEIAQRRYPERIRVETGVERMGKHIYKTERVLVRGLEIKQIPSSRRTSPEPFWDIVREEYLPLEDNEREAFLEREQKEEVARQVAAREKEDAYERITEPLRTTARAIEVIARRLSQALPKDHALRTSTDRRLAEITKLHLRLSPPPVLSDLQIKEVEGELHRQKDELIKTARISVRQAGINWAPDWPQQFLDLWESVPSVIDVDEFAQDSIRSEFVSRERLIEGLRVSLEGAIDNLMGAKEVDMAARILTVLEAHI